MKIQMKVIVLCMLFVSFCRGAAVPWDIGFGPVRYESEHAVGYGFDLTAPNGDGIGFTGIKVTKSAEEAILKNESNWGLALASHCMLLMETSRDVSIDYDFFFNSPGLFFQTYDYYTKEIQSETNLTIPAQESIFLAFAIAYPPMPPLTTNYYVFWYGWMELVYDYNEKGVMDVFIRASGIETTGRGIFAGTYTAVPEPSSAPLALSGVALLLRRRRNKSTLCST